MCHVGLEKVRNAIVGTSLLCNTLLLLVIHTTATDTAENSNHYWVLFLPLQYLLLRTDMNMYSFLYCALLWPISAL